MERWQKLVLFWVGVISALLLFTSPFTGLGLEKSPTAWTGVGSILAYVLTQTVSFKPKRENDDMNKKPGNESGGSDES